MLRSKEMILSNFSKKLPCIFGNHDVKWGKTETIHIVYDNSIMPNSDDKKYMYLHSELTQGGVCNVCGSRETRVLHTKVHPELIADEISWD